MNRYDESNKVTIISILLNIGLTVIKVIAGILGNSTAIIADGLHSASDIITSIGILIGNRISRKLEMMSINMVMKKQKFSFFYFSISTYNCSIKIRI